MKITIKLDSDQVEELIKRHLAEIVSVRLERYDVHIKNEGYYSLGAEVTLTEIEEDEVVVPFPAPEAA